MLSKTKIKNENQNGSLKGNIQKKHFLKRQETQMGGGGIRTPPLGNSTQRAHHWAMCQLVTQFRFQSK